MQTQKTFLFYRKKMEQSQTKRTKSTLKNREPKLPTLSTDNKLVYKSEVVLEETEDVLKEE